MMEIKPCPFCENENLEVKGSNTRFVRCERCGTFGPDAKSDEEAVRFWNAAPRKEDVEIKKSCANCVHISKEVDGKVYCCETVNEIYGCNYYEPKNPFAYDFRICRHCKHSYGYQVAGTDTIVLRCGRNIGRSKEYVCDKWEAKEPEPAPLNSENSSGLKTLCEKAISKWGEAAQIHKAIEELLELAIALTRYQNLNLRDEDYQEKAYKILDNIHEEREDVEIMLRQLDVIFGRSEEWQRKKYAHLQLIVGDTENE